VQYDWLVVVVASVVVGVSLEAESEVVDDVSVVVGSSVMVVMEVPAEGDGHERSGQSSWRLTFAAATPQPLRELCLFPVTKLVFELSSPESEPNDSTKNGLATK
jgi:hypothetical protein